MLRPLIAFCLLGTPAPADGPPPGFFAGDYEVLGRDGADPPRMIREFLRLVPDGADLEVETCDGKGGRLTFRDHPDLGNLVGGPVAGRNLWCSFYSDPDNYALILCHGEAGELLTFWPLQTPGSAPLACP